MHRLSVSSPGRVAAKVAALPLASHGGRTMHQHLHRVGDRVDRLLNALWDGKGTDLMLTAGLPPMVRVDGTLAPVAGEATLTGDDTDGLLAEVLSPSQQDAW